MSTDVHILCADWGKAPGKRRVWEIRRNTITVRPAPGRCGSSLKSILEYGRSLDGPVLAGIDAAIGAPAHIVDRFAHHHRYPQADFFSWIRWLFEHGQPDLPAHYPHQWSHARPFIAIPPGKGSKSAFRVYGIELNRECENGLASNSPIIVSGIPGTVGSGSRELWREMAWLRKNENTRQFSVWPFDGSLKDLLLDEAVVLAEIYPKACYGIALSAALPADLMTVAKTRAEARIAAIKALDDRIGHDLEIDEIYSCYASEDDFDAMISVVALYRLLSSTIELEPNHPVNQAEGAILGKSALLV